MCDQIWLDQVITTTFGSFQLERRGETMVSAQAKALFYVPTECRLPEAYLLKRNVSSCWKYFTKR